RKFIIENNIRFEEVVASNDLMFSLKVGVLAKRVEVSKEVIYKVEEGKRSMTTDLDPNKLTCRLDVLFRYNSYLISHGLSKQRLMMFMWLLKLFRVSPPLGVKYLFLGIYKKTPLFFDYRFKFIRLRQGFFYDK
ncbi:MAG: hypothetical protein HRT88_22595, partial [Lentisphaeraceae bacterium]|nr:hypothetical protein [Lentisphaeraceae bacterium]